MAYNKTNWKTGDVITAEKLNNLEDGVANAGVLVVHKTDGDNNTNALDKTWKEIKDAIDEGIVVLLNYEDTEDGNVYYYSVMLGSVAIIDNEYSVDTYVDGIYKTDNENGYPSNYNDGDYD